MQPHTRTIVQLAEQISLEHVVPHTCTDGQWYNPRAVTSGPCPTATTLRSLAAVATIGDQAVHGAAHHDEAVDAVMSAMLSTPLSELAALDADAVDPWRLMTRLALEGLAAWLDSDPTD